MLAPRRVQGLQPDIWRPILANLTDLTILITVACCSEVWFADESTISRNTELKAYASREIKKALRSYDDHPSPSAKVHRRVRCADHDCFCSVRNRKCRRIQRFIKALWLGDAKPR
jgi:hypothetical protein